MGSWGPGHASQLHEASDPPICDPVELQRYQGLRKQNIIGQWAEDELPSVQLTSVVALPLA